MDFGTPGQISLELKFWRLFKLHVYHQSGMGFGMELRSDTMANCY